MVVGVLLGTFPAARLSMALLSSSREGLLSSMCMVVMPSIDSKAKAETVHSGVELEEVIHPSVHLLALVCDHCPAGRLDESCLALGWSQCLLYAFIHPPDVACE